MVLFPVIPPGSAVFFLKIVARLSSRTIHTPETESIRGWHAYRIRGFSGGACDPRGHRCGSSRFSLPPGSFPTIRFFSCCQQHRGVQYRAYPGGEYSCPGICCLKPLSPTSFRGITPVLRKRCGDHVTAAQGVSWRFPETFPKENIAGNSRATRGAAPSP